MILQSERYEIVPFLSALFNSRLQRTDVLSVNGFTRVWKGTIPVPR